MSVIWFSYDVSFLYLFKIRPSVVLKQTFNCDHIYIIFCFTFIFRPFNQRGEFYTSILGPNSASKKWFSGSIITPYFGSYLLQTLNLNIKHPSIPPVIKVDFSSWKNARWTSLIFMGIHPTSKRCSLKIYNLKSVEIAR